MSRDEAKKQLVERFQAASAPLDDDRTPMIENHELLLRWEAGELEPHELDLLSDELATNPEFRREVSEMIKADLLQLPAGSEDAADIGKATVTAYHQRQQTKSVSIRPPAGRKKVWIAVISTAAMLLVAVGIVTIVLRPASPEEIVRRAGRELESGDSESAYRRLHKLLQGDLDSAVRSDAVALIESAAYRLERAEIEQQRLGLAG
ncbi:MAG: hypothetical protein IH991_24830, partial [Planctomycetes bacterium]|nr:hypothetical protein [Planctomycetota bacterium]